MPFDFIAFTSTLYPFQKLYQIPLIKLPWIQSAFLVAFLLFSGLFFQSAKATKKQLIVGLCVYGGAAFCVFSHRHYALMIIARLLQGIGLSMILPSILKLLNYPHAKESFRALALYLLAGLFISPWISSWVISSLSPVWLFYVLGFYAALIAILTFIILPKEKVQAPSIDTLGFLLIGGSMAIFILSLAVGLFWGWGLSSLFFFLSFLCFNLAFFYEQKQAHPLFDLELFKSKPFWSCFFPLLFLQFVLWPVVFLIALYLQYYLSIPLISFGLWLLILTGAVFVGHLFSLKGYEKGYIRMNVGLCLLWITLSLFLFSFVSESGYRSYFFVCLGLLGLGWGHLFLNTYTGSIALFTKKVAKAGFPITEILPFFFGAIGLSIMFNFFLRRFNRLFYQMVSDKSLSFSMDVNNHFFELLKRSEAYPDGVVEAFRESFILSFQSTLSFLSWIGFILLVFSLIFIPAKSKETFSNK